DSERLLYGFTTVVIAAIFTLFAILPEGDVRIGLINRILTAVVMLGVAHVVARQMRTRRELAEQRRRLADLMALQTDFVRAVSHDIRGPVGAVLGYVELLDSSVGGEPLSASQSRILDGIERSCRTVVALTDNLLTTASLDAGEFPVEHAPFDLAAMARDVATESVFSVRDRPDRVQVDAPPALPMVCDALRVRQILMNLLSNALKYSPSNREVRLVVERAAHAVRVRVIDRGAGIPASEQERIFEPFYQQSGARRKRAGVGLGLPLARRLARVLGGDLTVRSVMGEGSSFILELPDSEGLSRE
ncbi:MAG TPA: HAMP domain-containing sensor histidine kinase, partial [Gemmatimonadaceae bacterium]|nr:HAMP domain-containing sensor histidine kinase [Gemmatimonadaceae bacterium]